jgi:hypothetical protein
MVERRTNYEKVGIKNCNNVFGVCHDRDGFYAGERAGSNKDQESDAVQGRVNL